MENLFLEIAPRIRHLDVQEIWAYADWPGRTDLPEATRKDLGIDLIAKLGSGAIVAIQCKFQKRKSRVSKQSIDSFITASGKRKAFDLRWLVSTAALSENALESIQNQDPPVRIISVWNFAKFDLKRNFQEHRTPYKRQELAIKRVVDHLPQQKRGKLVMACGTGKTFVSLRIAEKLVPDGGRVLVCAPSIALVSQIRREWLTHAERLVHGHVVCSDTGAGRESAARRRNNALRIAELECPVTTDPKRLAKILQEDRKSGFTVVFSTYQSLDQIRNAQGQPDVPAFDLCHR